MMSPRVLVSSCPRWLALVGSVAVAAGCDDPPEPGPRGALILTVRSTPTTTATEREVGAVDSLALHDLKIEAEWAEDADAPAHWITLSSAPITIEVEDAVDEALIGQYPVAAGEIRQIRFLLSDVELNLDDGSVEVLDGPPNLPSETKSGWKWEPDSVPVTIVADDMVGARALFDVAAGVHFNNGIGYQLMPTVPYEVFDPNPAAGEPGIFIDQLTVFFREGTTRADVDAINAQIGASVAFEPIIGSVWRIRLPPDADVRQGTQFYRSQDAVDSVLPALNYGPYTRPTEAGTGDPQNNYDYARAPAAWDAGHVGSRAVRVAVIDATGVDLRNDDLCANYALNPGEIPDRWLVEKGCAETVDDEGVRRQCLEDADGDGFYTFGDLQYPANNGGFHGADCIAHLDEYPVCDHNNNFCIDATDVLTGENPEFNVFAHLVDDLDNDNNGFKNDLVGIAFTDETWSNNPDNVTAPQDEADGHGTAVAGLVGAMASTETVTEGSRGTVGIAHEVSIMAIRAGTAERNSLGNVSVATPDVEFYQALTYIEAFNKDSRPDNDIDVVVVSMGTTFATSSALRLEECGTVGGSNPVIKVGKTGFSDNVADAIADQRTAAAVLDMQRPEAALYVFAAGNHYLNLSSDHVFEAPGELFRSLVPASVIVAGNWVPTEQGGVLIPTDPTFSRTSSYGGQDTIDLWAPGNEWDILPTTDATIVTPKSGTSLSAPVVGGAAVLVAARHPTWTAAELKAKLLETAWENEEFAQCEEGGELHGDTFTVKNIDVTRAAQ